MTGLSGSSSGSSQTGTGVPSRCQVERGDPAVVLLRASVGARLLVLGTREHSAVGGVFGTTTVSRCVDNARCAVEICVDQHAAASAGARADLGRNCGPVSAIVDDTGDPASAVSRSTLVTGS